VRDLARPRANFDISCSPFDRAAPGRVARSVRGGRPSAGDPRHHAAQRPSRRHGVVPRRAHSHSRRLDRRGQQVRERGGGRRRAFRRAHAVQGHGQAQRGAAGEGDRGHGWPP